LNLNSEVFYFLCSYLKDKATLARYEVILPFSITMSNLMTSATLRSRKVFEAALTAVAAASSHDLLLVPTSSVIR
jgi:hypothetical protein